MVGAQLLIIHPSDWCKIK